MRFQPILLFMLAFVPIALPAYAQDDTAPPGPCEVIKAKERDQAQINFSIVARETNHTQYDPNWVDWQKVTRFEGSVELDFALDTGGCDEQDLVDQTASDPTDPVAPPPSGPEPFDQSAFMMQQMAACQNEADPTKAMECLAGAADLAQDMADRCSNPVAGTPLPEICGGGSGPSSPVVAALPPHDAEDLPVVETFVDDHVGFAEWPISEENAAVEIFRPVLCTGTTTVTGSGTGYDQSYMRQPNYSFDIGANWTSPAQVGGSGGCSAGAIVNPITGRVTIVLQPGPRNIRIERRFNNFRGLEEQPEETFEALDGKTDLQIDFFVDPEDVWGFQGRRILPDVVEHTQYSDRVIETEANFSFFAAN